MTDHPHDQQGGSAGCHVSLSAGPLLRSTHDPAAAAMSPSHCIDCFALRVLLLVATLSGLASGRQAPGLSAEDRQSVMQVLHVHGAEAQNLDVAASVASGFASFEEPVPKRLCNLATKPSDSLDSLAQAAQKVRIAEAFGGGCDIGTEGLRRVLAAASKTATTACDKHALDVVGRYVRAGAEGSRSLAQLALELEKQPDIASATCLIESIAGVLAHMQGHDALQEQVKDPAVMEGIIAYAASIMKDLQTVYQASVVTAAQLVHALVKLELSSDRQFEVDESFLAATLAHLVESQGADDVNAIAAVLQLLHAATARVVGQAAVLQPVPALVVSPGSGIPLEVTDPLGNPLTRSELTVRVSDENTTVLAEKATVPSQGPGRYNLDAAPFVPSSRRLSIEVVGDVGNSGDALRFIGQTAASTRVLPPLAITGTTIGVTTMGHVHNPIPVSRRAYVPRRCCVKSARDAKGWSCVVSPGVFAHHTNRRSYTPVRARSLMFKQGTFWSSASTSSRLPCQRAKRRAPSGQMWFSSSFAMPRPRMKYPTGHAGLMRPAAHTFCDSPWPRWRETGVGRVARTMWSSLSMMRGWSGPAVASTSTSRTQHPRLPPRLTPRIPRFCRTRLRREMIRPLPRGSSRVSWVLWRSDSLSGELAKRAA